MATVAVVAASIFAAAPALADESTAPTLLTPASGAWENTSSYHVEWTDLGDPQYVVQLSNSDATVDGSLANVTASFSFGTNSSDGPFADGSYYYQIKGVASDGVSTNWSPVYLLNTDTTAPVVSFTSPSGLTVAAGDNLTLSASIVDTDQLGNAHTVNTHFKVVGYGVVTPDSTESNGTGSFTFSTAGMAIGSQTAQLATKDQAGNFGNVVQLPFTVTPAKVVLDSPADGTLTNNASPTLSWLSTSEGDTYEFQAATDNTATSDGSFAHPGVDVSSLTGLSYTPTAPVDATYFWHVRAVQGGINGPWSDLRSVTVDTTKPAAPVQVAPANNSAIGGHSVDLQWTSPEVGATYTVRSSTSGVTDGDGMLTGIGGGTADTTAMDYTVAGIPDNTYYWQVRATDAAGNVGPWSPAWKVTIDTTAPVQVHLKAPSDNAVLTTRNFDATWFKAEDGATYEIQSTDTSGTTSDGSFSSPLMDATTTNLKYSYTNVSDDHFSWHVRAIDAAGNVGAWSATWHATVDATAPIAPTLTAPTDGQYLTTRSVHFSWSEPETGLTYEVRYGTSQHTDSHGKLTDVSDGGDSTTHAGAFVTSVHRDGTYYWEVRATDAAGNVGPWSDVSAFTVDTVKPDRVQLSSPSNNSYENTGSFSLRWHSVEAHASYQLESSLDGLTNPDGSFTNPVINPPVTSAAVPWVITSSTSYALTGVPDATYYWQVRAVDQAGNIGRWSGAWKVTVDSVSPAQPSLTSPDDNALLNTSRVRLAWDAVEPGVTYTVEWSRSDATGRDGGFRHPIVSHGTGRQHFTLHSVSDGTYYWHVIATDAAGNSSSWSEIRTVTIDTTAPATVLLTSPSDNSVNTTGSFDLDWQASETGLGYILELSHSSATNPDGSYVTPIDSTSLATNTQSFTGLTDTSFYWHVLATDAAGNISPSWSESWLLTVTLPSGTSTDGSAGNSAGSGAGTGSSGDAADQAINEQLTTHALTTPDSFGSGSKSSGHKSAGSTHAAPTSSVSGFPWWGWLIAAIAALLLLLLAFLLFRRRGIA